MNEFKIYFGLETLFLYLVAKNFYITNWDMILFPF